MTRRRPHRAVHAAPRSTVKRSNPARVEAPATLRIAAIDGLRGAALCLMIAYHFSFDLHWFGYIRADFDHDPVWLGFRAVIVSAFMLLVGLSLLLARRAGVSRRHFWRRIALIAFCAILVSVASYLTFPQTFITFGILHCIALASVLAWPATRFPRIALVAGIAIVAVGNLLALPVFDTRWLQWLGMMTHRPATEDYVPLLPWLGVVMIGIALGHWLSLQEFRPLHPLSRITPRWLIWMGRHSLLIYMLHQPILIGLLRVLRD
ncbi:MAG TPA: heparan-alpha-glucosaminide N-acetyltransferase [Casimicrobiaceae bacterium]|nr:heparan-alpha-glucosaminide N-acetyltransferase [Casimicrobiaceae bacterium]